jgi:autotransporter-associated beta strand protein
MHFDIKISGRTMKSGRRRIHLGKGVKLALAAALGAVVSENVVATTDVYWSGTSNNSSSTSAGWNAGTSWYTTASGTTAFGSVPTTGDTAVFSYNGVTSTAEKVDLNANQSIDGLIFVGTDTGGVTIQNGTGTDTLTLGTGGITMNAGTGAVTISSAIAIAGTETWNSSAASSLLTVTGGISGSGTLNLSPGSGNMNFSTGAISGSVAVAVNAGIVTFSSMTNTYSGGTTVSGGGILNIATVNAVPSTNTNTLNNGSFAYINNFTGNANLPSTDAFVLGASGGGIGTLYSVTNFVVQGTVTGTGNILTINPLSTDVGGVSLSNSNNSYGGTVVANGTLEVQTSGAAGGGGVAGASPITLDAGTTLQLYDHTLGSYTPTVYNAINLSGNATINQPPQSSSTPWTIKGIISGSAGFNVSGGGTVILAPLNTSNTGYYTANTYTGNVSVNSSTLELLYVGGIASNTTTTLNGGTLEYNYNFSTPTYAQLSTTKPLVIGSSGGTISNLNYPNTTFEILGQVTGAGALTFNSTAGAVSLVQTNNSYAGTTVAGGTLQLESSGAAGTGQINLSSGTVLDLMDNYFSYSTSYIASIANTIALNGNATISTPSTTQFWTLTGVISGSFGLTKTGSGTLILAPASGGLFSPNLYTGGTTVSAGTLELLTVDGLPITGTVTLASGTTLEYNNSSATPILAVPISLAGTSGTSATIYLPTATQNFTESGLISGTGTLIKTGAATLTLTDTNTYSGGSNVSAGTLALGNGGSFGTGGVLDDSAVAFSNSTALSVSNVISGTGTVTQSGAGTTTLSGTDTYSGTTNISAGTLAVNGSLATASTVNVATAGTLAGSGTIGGNTTVTGSGTINLSSGAVISGTLAATGGNWNGQGTVNGVVTSSSGTLNIGSGANLTATAGLNVTGGTISSTDSTGTITGSVNYTSPSSSTFNGVIAGSGSTVTMNSSSATLTLAGINTYGGGTTITAGVLNVGSAQGSTSGPLGASVSGVPTGTITFAGGTLQYSSANSADYSPAFAATAQPISIDTNGQAVTFASPLMPGTSGSLALTDSNASPGSMTLSASNSFTGGTTVSAGTLIATNAAALGTGNVAINGSSTFNVGGGSALALNLGSGNYTQAAGATLSLQVSNSSSFSSIQTTGTASVGGTLNMNVGSGAVANDVKFQVLNTGGITGTFSGYTTNTLPSGVAVDTSNLEKTGQLALVSYFNGFENVNGTWSNNSSTFAGSINSYVLGSSATVPGNAVQVVNPAFASSNSAYGKLTPTAYTLAVSGGGFPTTANVGPATHFNGDSASFGTGFTTQADIYLNPAWTGDTNGIGFDYSSAVSNSSGGYLRDFILHCYSVAGTLYVSADNNSDYTPDPKYLTEDANNLAITTAGWYTVQDTFYNNAGTLAVAIKLFSSGSTTPVFEQTLSDTNDAISGVGGNNYAWFVNIDTGSGANNYLDVDNVKLINNTGSGLAGPAVVTSGLTLLGNAHITGSTATFDIGGTKPGAVTNGYDYLNVTNGVASLSGDLNVDFVDGFENQITSGETFTVFQASSINGAFDNVTNGERVETGDGSGSFLANYVTSDGTTSLVLSDFQAGSVPEPGTLGLLAIGAVGLLQRRRRAPR